MLFSVLTYSGRGSMGTIGVLGTKHLNVDFPVILQSQHLKYSPRPGNEVMKYNTQYMYNLLSPKVVVQVVVVAAA